MQALSYPVLLGLPEARQAVAMSSDRISTQRVGTGHRRALWVLVTCTVAVGAFALAWILRPAGDSQRDRSDAPPPSTEGCTSLTAKLDAADARVAELEGNNRRCRKRTSMLDTCLTKQLACEKTAKAVSTKLAEAEAARDGAINEKNRAAVKANDSLSEANESSKIVARLTEENTSLKRRMADQLNKSRTDYAQLKRLFDKLCADCGAKCARSCPR